MTRRSNHNGDLLIIVVAIVVFLALGGCAATPTTKRVVGALLVGSMAATLAAHGHGSGATPDASTTFERGRVGTPTTPTPGSSQ